MELDSQATPGSLRLTQHRNDSRLKGKEGHAFVIFYVVSRINFGHHSGWLQTHEQVARMRLLRTVLQQLRLSTNGGFPTNGGYTADGCGTAANH
jgi:hypothetical protein